MASPQTFTASGTWLCPAGVTAVQAQCWGGGANGIDSKASNSGGGGKGADFAQGNAVAVVAGNTYTVTVGAAYGTNGGRGNDSSFAGASVTILAKGGNSLSTTSGDVTFTGGTSGAGLAVGFNGAGGGGGGGGAGSGGNGGNGTSGNNSTTYVGGTAGSAGTPDGGVAGAGGIGNNPTQDPALGNGHDGTIPGGGGGGAGTDAFSGTYTHGGGARGQVILTWVVTAATRSVSGGAAYSGPMCY